MQISAFNIFQTSLAIGLSNWKKLRPYLVALFIPTFITVTLAVVFSYLEELVPIPALTLFGNVLVLLTILASLVVNFWIVLALTVALKNILEDQPILPWKQGLKNTKKLIIPAVLSSLLASLIILFSSILFIIPGIITFIWFLFTLYAILFEQTTVTGALKRSKDLVVGHWWQIAWAWLLPFIIYALITSVIGFVASSAIDLIPDKLILWQAAIWRLISTIIGIVLAPAILSAPLILYLTVKKVKNNQKENTSIE